ncbi:hypothetical protein METHPM2_50008 [Pseudomonas sp. PM2]
MYSQLYTKKGKKEKRGQIYFP